MNAVRKRDDKQRWFYCLTHRQPEFGTVCPNVSRLGPYATELEALAAIDRMNARNATLIEQEELEDKSQS